MGQRKQGRKKRYEFTQWWMMLLALIIASSIIFGIWKFITKPAAVLDKVTDPDHIISSYEEFHNMYNSCLDICGKIGAIELLQDGSSSGGFTKEERIINLKNNLSRWVNEYNSKSNQISRNLWKSNDLPHSLNLKSICNEE